MGRGEALHREEWTKVADDVVELPSSLKYVNNDAFKSALLDGKKKLAIVGTQDSLSKASQSGLIPEALNKIFETILGKLEPTIRSAGVKSTILLDGPGSLEELIVGAVSTEVSRHMAPTRPDQITAFIKSHVKASEETALLLVPPSESDVEAYITSVPKGNTLTSFKKGNESFDQKRTQTLATVWVPGSTEKEETLKRAQIIAESVQLAARLGDLPPNFLNTESYATIVERLGKKFGFKVKVIAGDDVQKEGMNLLYAVGRAAEYPAALVIASHEPEGKADEESIVLAGKGIIYDTGGLSLKPTTAMAGMKYDMGGSAAVLGAFVAAVRLGTQEKIHALLALADNAVSSDSVRNDDIVRCLSGKTVEIQNTDAEGRLVLVDAVAYAHKYLKPKKLIDVATLTGAQRIVTGSHHAAVMSNQEKSEQEAIAAGKLSGDQAYPIIFAPELHLPLLDSAFADAKNIGTGDLGTSIAGLFIYDIGFGGSFDGEWTHIDIAYPAVFAPQKSGTGFGVGILLNILKA